MKNKKVFAGILVAVVLLLCFAGCNAERNKSEIAYSADRGEDSGFFYEAETMPSQSVDNGKFTSDSASVQQQKLIRTMRVSAQTQDMDPLLSAVEAKVKALGGYIESKSVHNGTSGTSKRSADLTIRVPAETLDAFLEHISGESNVVSVNENVSDITLSYVATESRILALETEQQRLLELMEKAENMSDLLQIEARLTDVRSELEAVMTQLRIYDNQVSYGTLHLSVTEVKEYTVVEEGITLWQRIGNGLSENWEGFCEKTTDLFVFLAVYLPFLLPIGVIVIGLILLRRRYCRKKRKDTTAEKAEHDDEE